MRLEKLARDEKFAWEVLRQSVYSTLALVKADGTPIAVPVNAVGDDVYKVIYFHCAGAGEKWEILQTNPQVSLSAVSEGEALDMLRRCQPDTLTPIEAMQLVYELKQKLN